MTRTPPRIDAEATALMERVEAEAGENPALAAINRAFVERVKTLGVPGRKHEMFTFVDTKPLIAALATASLADKGSAQAGLVKSDVYPGSEKSVIVIAGGFNSKDHTDISGPGNSVSVKNLDEAVGEEWVKDRLLVGAAEENDIFAAINGALMRGGVVIDIKPGSKLSAPLQILLTGAGSGAALCAPRVIIRAGASCEAEVVVKTAGAAKSFNIPVIDLIAEKNASVRLYHVQADDETAACVFKTRAVMAGGSRVKAVLAYSGGSVARGHLEARLMESGAALILNGVAVLDGAAQAHTYVRVHHEAPECESDQLFRNIVDGRSRASVDGTVTVHPGAQLTRSAQLINNLMLSGEARADVKPNLMIYADDVKCSHGATTGRVDEEQLFYMRTRGFSEAAARAILTSSFAKSVIETIENGAVAEDVSKLLLGKLEG